MRRNYIPYADGVFNQWQANLLVKLVAGAEGWHFPEEALAVLVGLQARWRGAYATALDPATRTKGAVREKQVARKVFEDELRVQLRAYVTYNPLVTDRQREEMELPVHKRTHSPAPVATAAPWVHARTHLLRHVFFDYGTSEVARAKPEGQHGIELVWDMAEEKPLLVQDLGHSCFDTHTPLVLEFEEGQRGKALWFAARWENTRGLKGPWTEIQHTIIP
jgi:hypothetical protein